MWWERERKTPAGGDRDQHRLRLRELLMDSSGQRVDKDMMPGKKMKRDHIERWIMYKKNKETFYIS